MSDEDHIGALRIGPDGEEGGALLDAWSNIIHDEDGTGIFRLVAMAATNPRSRTDLQAFEKRMQEKDVLLREWQHRVKNNLQIITALLRLESRNAPVDAAGEALTRLTGRVSALALLHRSLSPDKSAGSVDLKVNTCPVSINVAMPMGLGVDQALTNALKHAFVGRAGGTITLHGLLDAG